MTPNNTHHILRQVLELNLSRTDGVIDLQSAAARTFQERGLREIEAVFDQIAGPEQLIRLERVEIDLGELHGSDWQEQFSRRLAEQLQESLTKILQNADQSSQQSPFNGSLFDGLFQQFLFFCQHGRLPWESRKLSRELLETLPSTMTEAQWQSLTMLLRNDDRALRRLIYTVSDEFLQTLPQILCNLEASARVRILLMPGELSERSQALWRDRFWLTVLQSIISATATSNTHLTSTWSGGVMLVQQLLAERQKLIETSSTDTSAGSPTRSDMRSADTSSQPLHLPKSWQTWMESVPPSFKVSLHSATEVVPPAPEAFGERASDRPRHENPDRTSTPPTNRAIQTGEAEQTSFLSSRLDLPAQQYARDASEEAPISKTSSTDPWLSRLPANSTPFEQDRIQRMPTPDLTEPFYVEGAGAVIVHPFLQELFSSLDLLNDLQFCARPAQRRAVALTTYLTYGDIDVLEYDLLLPKLLCAWPWEEPLPPYELNAPERLACEELLAAALKHWSVLRTDSADWLRQQFFWRDGKLTPVDFGWQLTVERRAQDVLLDKLPWGIGTIRLPWMSDFLHVSWTS